jgi:tight adherence protein B
VSPGLLLILTFAAGVLAVVGAYSVFADLFRRDRVRLDRRLDEEFHRKQRQRIRSSALYKDLGRLAAEAATDDRPKTIRHRVAEMIDQSGLSVTPARLLGLMAAVGLGVGTLAFLARPSPVVPVVAGLPAAVVPFLYVHFKRKARLQKMLQQLPDAFDLMSRVIRAGQTTPQALQAVVDEFDQPIAGEFAYCYEQQNLGLSPEVSFRDLARRTGLLEVKIFVLALLIQQQTGGNLAEILDKLSAVVRERFRMRNKIKALTAEGRMQGLVLLVLPFAMVGIMMMLNQSYADTVARHPMLLVVMAVIEGVGAVWIRKIVNFDF